MSRPVRRAAAAVALLLVPVTACASIPESSEPRAVRSIDEGNATQELKPLPKGIDALSLVRSFVDDSAKPASDHEAARRHLTPQAAQEWSPTPGLLIVEDVDTIPVPQDMPLPEGVQLVSVQGDKVGRLQPDQSFVPESGPYRIEVRVERQPDGEWRIAEPPPGLVAGRAAFAETYRQLPIYFLNHEGTGVVPDLRYVPALPSSTLPRRVIDLLVTGPSEAFRDSLRSAIPPGVVPKTNTSESPDGALEVNLSDLGDLTAEQRQQIAAQTVFSLQSVSSARVRLKEEGRPLLDEAGDLRPSDVASFETEHQVRADLPGMAVVNESLVLIDDSATPVPGAVGSGEYRVLQAGRSLDGEYLAAVTRRPGGVALRVGEYGAQQLAELDVAGSFMTKPTWRTESEVWTVVDGSTVVRAHKDGDRWVTERVEAPELVGAGQIEDLRIAPGGTRLAAVVDGRILVAGIGERDDQLVVQHPTPLVPPENVEITGLEWRGNDALVAITGSSSSPVYDVSVDGFEWTRYTALNLGQRLTGVTVAQDGRVIVADSVGLWQTEEPDNVWAVVRVPIGGGSIPFFPG
ncbi:LpqB family beta-propeller domain-containing protein [Saccharopolyspora sp. CA-218241]|uniref:LpqB family beta-propeller domain-containing protein n=1 Tax=Saccharopolyspora sp. CA-218241 TaxID=3240027 RepID=UPI003D962142